MMVDVHTAAEWLRRGGIVAFPTDTFYGLAVDPTSPAAVQALFDLKGRGAASALPLIAASAEQVEAVCGPLSTTSARLAARFWPGPLSLIIDVPAGIAPAVSAGTNGLAVRVPDHPIARALAAAFGGLLTATSANLSGSPPAATASALGLVGRDARVRVIDGGETPGGAPSTIVDARNAGVVLVREGAVAWTRVLESLNE